MTDGVFLDIWRLLLRRWEKGSFYCRVLPYLLSPPPPWPHFFFAFFFLGPLVLPRRFPSFLSLGFGFSFALGFLGFLGSFRFLGFFRFLVFLGFVFLPRFFRAFGALRSPWFLRFLFSSTWLRRRSCFRSFRSMQGKREETRERIRSRLAKRKP